MNAFKCPDCGALLVEGSAACGVCKSDIDWEGGQPMITTAGRAFGRVAIVFLIAVFAAGLVLAAVLLAAS